MARIFPKLHISEKGETALRGGHPWVYGEELTICGAEPENGALVDVYSAKDRYLGTGFYNNNSKIRVRILSRNANDTFDAAFWQRRVRYALDYRRAVMGVCADDFRDCRLIFGEADGFPGLTVDRFENILVAQVLSLGMEMRKNIIFDALRTELPEIAAIYERNDVALRTLEGMKEKTGYYWEKDPGQTPAVVRITENGLLFDVDYINGQKTGYFLDQKYNRRAIRPIAQGRRVLDCFTHTGPFALNAAAAGAVTVNAVDVSMDALSMARHNAEINGISNMRYTCADVFELLTGLERSGERPYDFIILDPPAFTKSRDTLKNAIRGYRDINYRAMKILPRGGYLATCSCSHFMTETYFKQMLHNASKDAGVTLRQIECRKQAPDHPILWNVPETDYLKFFIFQIV